MSRDGGASAAIDLRFGEGIALPVEEVTFANGLRLLLVPEPKPVLTLMLWIGAGLLREPPGRSGISHALEHGYSLGSAKLGPRELDAIVNELGGTKNAFTSHDATAYHVNIPSAGLDRLVELESDRFAHLALPPDAVARELEVIREERRLRVDNQPTGRLRETLLALAYERHPYRYPIIGTASDLDRLDRDALERYYRATYEPSNALFVLAGGFDPAQARAAFARWFGGLPRGSAAADAGVDAGAAPASAPAEPEQRGERREVIDRATPNVPHVAMLQKLPAFDHDDTAALEVLGEVLLGGRSSRLPRRLVRERKLVTALQGGYWGLRDPSPFTVIARAQHGVQAEQVEEAISEVFDEVRAHGVSAGEIDEVRARLRMGALAGLETTQGRASTLGRFETTSRRGWRGVGAWFERLSQVGPAEVRRVAESYFGRETRTVVWQLPTAMRGRTVEVRGRTGPPPRREPPPAPALPPRPPRLSPAAEDGGPSAGAAGAASAAGPAASAAARSAPPLMSEPFGERARRAVLPNGLTVLIEPCGAVPIAAVALAVPAGAAHDPASTRGLASITASLLRTGTARFDEEGLNGAFAALGASLSVSAGPDVTQLSTLVESQDLDEALALFAEVALHPAFPDDKLERVRAEQSSRLRAWRADPHELIDQAFVRALFGAAHPYGWPIAGTIPGVEAIARADVEAFFASRFRPRDAVLVVSGHVDPARALDAAARAFEGWAAPARAPGGARAGELAGSGPGRDADAGAGAGEQTAGEQTTGEQTAGEGAVGAAAPPAATGGGWWLVPKGDQSQAHLRIGLPLFGRGHPDWDAMTMLSAVLGAGGLSSRIPSRVRTEQGLAYSARSFLIGRRIAGGLVLAAETRTAEAARAAAILEEELGRIAREPVGAAELERARARLVGTLPFRRETVAQRAAALVNAFVHGLGPDYLERQVERFAALDPAALAEVARRDLAPARLARVAVGEPRALGGALDGAAGPVTVWEEDALDHA